MTLKISDMTKVDGNPETDNVEISRDNGDGTFSTFSAQYPGQSEDSGDTVLLGNQKIGPSLSGEYVFAAGINYNSLQFSEIESFFDYGKSFNIQNVDVRISDSDAVEDQAAIKKSFSYFPKNKNDGEYFCIGYSGSDIELLKRSADSNWDDIAIQGPDNNSGSSICFSDFYGEQEILYFFDISLPDYGNIVPVYSNTFEINQSSKVAERIKSISPRIGVSENRVARAGCNYFGNIFCILVLEFDGTNVGDYFLEYINIGNGAYWEINISQIQSVDLYEGRAGIRFRADDNFLSFISVSNNATHASFSVESDDGSSTIQFVVYMSDDGGSVIFDDQLFFQEKTIDTTPRRTSSSEKFTYFTKNDSEDKKVFRLNHDTLSVHEFDLNNIFDGTISSVASLNSDKAGIVCQAFSSSFFTTRYALLRDDNTVDSSSSPPNIAIAIPDEKRGIVVGFQAGSTRVFRASFGDKGVDPTSAGAIYVPKNYNSPKFIEAIKA